MDKMNTDIKYCGLTIESLAKYTGLSYEETKLLILARNKHEQEGRPVARVTDADRADCEGVSIKEYRDSVEYSREQQMMWNSDRG